MPSIFRSFFICLKCVCSKFQVVSWIERLWSVGQKISVFGSCDHDRTSYNVDFRIPLANLSHHLAGLFLRRVSHRLLSLLQLNHPQKDTSRKNSGKQETLNWNRSCLRGQHLCLNIATDIGWFSWKNPKRKRCFVLVFFLQSKKYRFAFSSVHSNQTNNTDMLQTKKCIPWNCNLIVPH